MGSNHRERIYTKIIAFSATDEDDEMLHKLCVAYNMTRPEFLRELLRLTYHTYQHSKFTKKKEVETNV